MLGGDRGVDTQHLVYMILGHHLVLVEAATLLIPSHRSCRTLPNAALKNPDRKLRRTSCYVKSRGAGGLRQQGPAR